MKKNFCYTLINPIKKGILTSANKRTTVLLFTVIVSLACVLFPTDGKSQLYSNKDKSSLHHIQDFRMMSSSWQQKSEPTKDLYTLPFELYADEDSLLRGPSDAEDPIGGITPIGDGICLLSLLALGYIGFQYRKNSKKHRLLNA